MSRLEDFRVFDTVAFGGCDVVVARIIAFERVEVGGAFAWTRGAVELTAVSFARFGRGMLIVGVSRACERG